MRIYLRLKSAYDWPPPWFFSLYSNVCPQDGGTFPYLSVSLSSVLNCKAPVRCYDCFNSTIDANQFYEIAAF